MKNSIFLLLLLAFTACSNDKNDKAFTHVISNEMFSIADMSEGAVYTVYYCWTDWCPPCLSSMDSTLRKTKAVTDSIGIPISYHALLYAPKVKERSEKLMQNAYANGIEVYYKSASSPLTKKMDINSDFSGFEGFESEFRVPRIVLIDQDGNLLTDDFRINYKLKYFLESLETQFPEYFEGNE